MNTLNILKKACVYLNKSDEYSLLDSENEVDISASVVCNTLLFCLNYVIKRIATEFCFSKTFADIQIGDDNYFDLDNLQNNLFSVIQLKNEDGCVPFYEDGEGIRAKKGKYTLTYAIMPQDLEFLDDITFFPSCKTKLIYSHIEE